MPDIDKKGIFGYFEGGRPGRVALVGRSGAWTRTGSEGEKARVRGSGPGRDICG